MIGIYGSAIRKHLDMESAVSTHLFFTKEKSFNAIELHRLLNDKPNVSSIMISGDHGFYSREVYSSPLIKTLNSEILNII